MENILKILGVAAICILLAFIIRRDNQSPAEPLIELTQKTDTITLRDTIYIQSPLPATTQNLGFTLAKLPIWRETKKPAQIEEHPFVESGTNAESEDEIETDPPDSITVQIPIEQRHYQSEDYEAWVSGWNPNLDSLRIYKTSQHLTTTKEITRWKTRHWGLSVGVGAVVSPKGGIQPGIFIGATYTFLSF